MASDMTLRVQNENTAVLACAVELGCQTLLSVAGNEISNFVDGEEVSLAFVQNAFLARLKAHLTPSTILAAGGGNA